MVDWNTSNPTPAILLWAVVTVCAVVNMPRFQSIDFYHWWVIPKVTASDSSVDFYETENRRRFGEIYYQRFRKEGPPLAFATAQNRNLLDPTGTPFLYSVLSPFSGSEYAKDFRRYQLVTGAFFWAAISILFICADFRFWKSLALSAAVIAGYHPVHCDLWVGGTNSFILLATALILFLLRRGGAKNLLGAGLIVGLGILFKPNFALVPAVLLSLWVATGQRASKLKFLVGMALGLTSGFAFSVWYFESISPWWFWVSNALRPLLKSTDYSSELGNLAPAQILFDRFGIRPGYSVLLFSSLAVWLTFRLVQTSATKARQKGADFEVQFLAVGLGGGFMCLVTNLAWAHYQVLLLPLLVIGYRHSKNTAQVALLMAFCMGLSFEAWIFGAENFLTRGINVVSAVGLLCTVYNRVNRTLVQV